MLFNSEILTIIEISLTRVIILYQLIKILILLIKYTKSEYSFISIDRNVGTWYNYILS